MRIAGLAAGAGRTLRHLHRRAPGGAKLAAVVAPAADAPVVEWARQAEIETAVVDPKDGGALRDAFEGDATDLVCLDGWPGKLPDGIPTALAAHPSLLPAFAEGDPIETALDAGVAVTGSTVHVVASGAADTSGPIVTQEPVPVYDGDDREALKRRVLHEGEFRAYPRAVRWFAEGRVSLTKPGEVTVEGDESGPFPARRLASGDRLRALRYGENPHQDAAVYEDPTFDGASVVGADELNPDAKALSYNNYNDADAALALAREFEAPAAAVIKHANPAGCATAASAADAYDRALRTDAKSAFGGIVALNRDCDVATAERIVDSYKEVVVAPGYEPGAAEVLRERPDLRVLDVGPLAPPGSSPAGTVEKHLAGGRLVQDRDDGRVSAEELEVVTEREPTPEELEAMAFAWPVVKHVKSNGIVLATGTETVGIGMGQASRVDAVRLAARKATADADGKGPEGAVMASDAFFPFPDGVEVAAEAGVEAVVQPGGSVNDDDVIAACDERGLAMAFTGQRAFRHG